MFSLVSATSCLTPSLIALKFNNSFYPFNLSLAEEFQRLFYPHQSYGEEFHISDIKEEFRRNGVDSDYCPDVDTRVVTQWALVKQNAKGKKKKGECVFCRNNGEERRYYQSHVLKDKYGKVTCPVLRAYICPVCGRSGDVAHTIKYCPENNNKESIPTVVVLKSMRTSTGQRRSFSCN